MLSDYSYIAEQLCSWAVRKSWRGSFDNESAKEIALDALHKRIVGAVALVLQGVKWTPDLKKIIIIYIIFFINLITLKNIFHNLA